MPTSLHTLCTCANSDIIKGNVVCTRYSTSFPFLSILHFLFLYLPPPLSLSVFLPLSLPSIDNRSKKVIAMKIIDLEEAEDEIEDIQQEIAVLSQCDSPHVTRYFGSYLKVPPPPPLSLSLSPPSPSPFLPLNHRHHPHPSVHKAMDHHGVPWWRFSS